MLNPWFLVGQRAVKKSENLSDSVGWWLSDVHRVCACMRERTRTQRFRYFSVGYGFELIGIGLVVDAFLGFHG